MLIHLIRHGEVENPNHVVYADMPGFGLSALGRSQAGAAGRWLADREVSLIVSSPLDRAVETAALIAEQADAPIETDSRLTEWLLATRWRGTRWPDLPEVFPGELEQYLDSPFDLPFSPESLNDLADRVASAVEEWSTREDTEVAFISHQDPIHAGYLRLTQSDPAGYHADKPQHCSILSLQRANGGWDMSSVWTPPQ